MKRIPPAIAEHLAGRHAVSNSVPLPGIRVEDVQAQIQNSVLWTMQLMEHAERLSATERSLPEWELARRYAAATLRAEFPDSDTDALVNEMAAMLSALPENPQRTPFEFWVYAMHLLAIRETASAHVQNPPLPWFDTLGVGHLNASISSFDDDLLILVRSGTKGFTNLLAKAILGFMRRANEHLMALRPGDQDEDPIPMLRELEEAKACVSVFKAYLFLGLPHSGNLVKLNEGEAMMAARLEVGMDTFVVAHEYAHALHQHHLSDLTVYEREIEADRTGIMLVIEAALDRGGDGVLEMCGAHAIVILQQIVTMLLREIAGDPTVGADYPNSTARCVNMFGACERRGMLSMQMEQVAQSYWSILGVLRDIIVPEVLEEARTRPIAPLWSTA